MPEPEKRKRGRPRGTATNSAITPVLALDRGLTVLRALASLTNCTLGDLARHVEMPVSTVHRVLATLQTHGFVEFEETTQKWAVGIGAFRVGSAYLARSNLIEASLKVMRPLMEQTGETANLGIAEGGNVVFISQVETQNPIRALFRQGTGSPMHASGIGKALMANMPQKQVVALLRSAGLPAFTHHTLTDLDALLADLSTIRSCGWSFDNEERYLGMRCVAAAVLNARGETIAGLSVSGPTIRFTDEVVAKTGPIVLAAANRLTEMMGGPTVRSS